MAMPTRQELIEQLQRARMPKGKPSPTPIAKVSEKKKQEIKEEKISGESKALKAYYDYHMTHSQPVCQECGSRADWLLLPEYSAVWKACQAHLLPKKKGAFPSIAANLDNHIVLFPSLGGKLCGHHGEYDSSWYNATTMKVWPSVEKIIIEKLVPHIAEGELRKLPEVIQNKIEQ